SQEGVTSGLAATDLRTLLHHVCARDLEHIEKSRFFARDRYAGAFDCRILAKMHVATTPTWREPKQKRGQKATRHL
ncbi:hypothetical protein, partial [Collinsella aerofaciens]|uniref:hypothetical protein n=1 Tax=Collinsella aerofaciens TaxID=74426 RepID=UPI003D792246